ncbi:N-acetylmuramoyl-L-alanine amidase [Anaerocolumna sp. AGMB13020]|uniref:N-acetylmuramoyl-L-alanine amidase n=1 Tax=Anaerocolumna sp. AGMB13020 TaxID=3081750 RepID=UPI0029544593|nr:N-acetylmuramoyl-L-alanine amidase [Anaerocolumna sp. AGMB13020]WOO37371.1 N-acetylmuramoyl-L-alanine amidase [Anaerocolumna sp. AGMB13020]
MASRIILDAGHGGYDNGAVYFGRMEKYDNLDLTLEIGEILTNNGVDVLYTRVDDVYVSPLERAYMANLEGADYFVSIHRNASPTPNTYSGVQSLVFAMDDPGAVLAANINQELEEVGFSDLGITVRTDLAVLRRTNMPAVLVEVGFINTDSDNTLFDERFDEIAYAIAAAILDTLGENTEVDGEYSEEDYSQEGMYNGNTGNGGSQNGNYENGNTGNGSSQNGSYQNEENQNGNTRSGRGQERNNQDYNGMNEESETDTEYREGENGEQAIYHIQLGLFNDINNANNLIRNLMENDIPADIIRQGEVYAVITGRFNDLDEAAREEEVLRQMGYSTLIVRDGRR